MNNNLFVGRETEISTLFEAYTEASNGKGNVIFIKGESGIGKTFLVDKFHSSLLERGEEFQFAIGHTTATSQFYEPLLPFRQIISSLTTENRGGKITKTKFYKTAEKLAPAWIGAIPGIGGITAAIAETLLELKNINTEENHQNGQIAFFNQFIKFTSNISGKNVLLLVLDDFQFADTTSLHFLLNLQREIVGLKIFLVVLIRDSSSNAMTNKLINLRKETLGHTGGAFTIISLKGLDFDDTEFFLQEFLIDKTIPHSVTRAICEKTSGNPLFIKEIINYWKTHNIIKNKHGRWVFPNLEKDFPIPRSIRETIELRLKNTTQLQRNILDIASIQGIQFNLNLLKQVFRKLFSQPIGSFYSDLKDLEESYGFIKKSVMGDEHDPTSERFIFSHGLHQQIVYENLLASQREEYHYQTALCLEDISHQYDRKFPSALGYHFKEGKEYKKASKYLLLAAETSLFELFAFRDALNLYEEIKNIMNDNQIDDSFLEFEVLVGLAHANRSVGKTDIAIGLYDEAIKLNNEKTLNEDNGILYQMLGVSYRGQEQFSDALNAYNKAKFIAERDNNRRLAGNVLRDIGYVLIKLNNLHDAKIYFSKGYEYLQSENDLAGAGMCQHGLAYVKYMEGNHEGVMRLLDEALSKVTKANHEYFQATILYYKAFFILEKNDLVAARNALDTGISISQEHGYDFLLIQLYQVKARYLFRLLEFEEGYSVFADALKLGYKLHNKIVQKIKIEIMTQVHSLSKAGNPEAATQFCEFLKYSDKKNKFSLSDSNFLGFVSKLQNFIQTGQIERINANEFSNCI